MHRRLLILLTLLALVAAGLSATANATVPRPAHSFGATIEDYTAYVPQDSCDPRPKTGTTKLGNLLTRTYPGTTWGPTGPATAR